MSSIALRQSHRTFKFASLFAGMAGGATLAYYSQQERSHRQSGSFGANSGGASGGKPSGFTKPVLAAGGALAAAPEGKTLKDYQQIYNDIAEKIVDQDDADEGAGRYGLLVRLAWHTSGTYKKKENSGGSYGGTMILSPESTDAGNAGLETGRDFLAEFCDKYPWLSRGDLWTLGGVVAVQEAGGPKIKWRPGRKNVTDRSKVPPNGLLPDATQGPSHVRDVFSRMGFVDQETVALIGAHCLGRCHTYRSGFDGPWGPSPNMFTNDFFVRLLQQWHVRKWDGPKQWEDDETNSFMMLPSDIALKEDSQFLVYVKKYAEDEQLFFADFSSAFTKLLENGIDFPKNSPYLEFKTLDDQDM